jgi:hypothetical protein
LCAAVTNCHEESRLRERWMQLAELAATEQDPERLSESVKEIDQLLAEKQDRLRQKSVPSKPSE